MFNTPCKASYRCAIQCQRLQSISTDTARTCNPLARVVSEHSNKGIWVSAAQCVMIALCTAGQALSAAGLASQSEHQWQVSIVAGTKCSETLHSYSRYSHLRAPVRHQSGTNQAPVEHQSGTNQAPCRHLSGTGQAPVNSQQLGISQKSSASQAPVRHLSSTSQALVTHQSGTSQAPVRHQSPITSWEAVTSQAPVRHQRRPSQKGSCSPPHSWRTRGSPR